MQKADFKRSPAYHVVRGLTVSRLVGGAVLPLFGLCGCWRWAAFVFVAGFLTDMLDGEMARSWAVVTASGERLDSSADVVLTFGALLAVTIGGGWHWAIIVGLAAGFLVVNWAKPRLRGDFLGMVILAMPVVNLTLIAVLSVWFVKLAGGNPGAMVSVEIAVGALICYLKRQRIADYYCMALKEADK